jgi:hypothetical protein
MTETICTKCGFKIQNGGYRCFKCGTSIIQRNNPNADSIPKVEVTDNGFIGWATFTISYLTGVVLGQLRGFTMAHKEFGTVSPFLQGLGIIGGSIFMVVMFFYCLRNGKFGIMRWEVTYAEMPLGYKIAQIVHVAVAGGALGYGIPKLFG